MNDTGKFFIVTALNFEQVALDEAKEKLRLFLDYDLDATKVDIVDGGFELELPLAIGYKLNNILKTPTKILLRIASFKSRDFPKLYNKLLKVNWRDYLLGDIPKVEVTSKKSRIINTTRVEETCDKAILKYYKANPPKIVSDEIKYKAHLIVNIRIINDVVTVSIDTTGKRLHFRANGKLIGEAPMRETLASSLLYYLKDECKNIDTIVDPMCGSGTILIEAMDFYSLNQRDFSYEFFPSYKKLEKIVPKEVSMKLFNEFYGYDSSPKMVDMAKANSRDRISIETRDASQAYPDSKKDVFMLINPPYGQRLIPDSKLDIFYNKIIKGIIETYEPKLVGMIVPTALRTKSISATDKYSVRSDHKFKNGGFNVKLIVIKKA